MTVIRALAGYRLRREASPDYRRWGVSPRPENLLLRSGCKTGHSSKRDFSMDEKMLQTARP